ncbi:MAG: HDOD domain-containing protein [Proteobacteria bacterium]|nr:HDOD domain-containing protein [Pseudomonadota bacterium]
MRFCGACGTHLATKVERPDPLIGSLVGNRFVILEKIAQGGMGVVYKAEQTGIWRPVAVKVLRPKFSQDEKQAKRFQNEASTASRLTHPNTITIYDFGVLPDKSFYIAMEFIKGMSLDEEIKNHDTLTWEKTCRIALQICGSLQEAHEHNIIHRDLKPANIMLTSRSAELDVVKVLDFGIAKIMADEGDENRVSLTARDEIFGTPEYMAPEQIRSEKLDPRTDIYALGVIVYRMLTGSLPFFAEAPLAMLAKHLMEDPIPFESYESSSQIPEPLTSLVLSSLAKNRADRPSSMGYIAEQLSDMVGRPSSVQTISSPRETAVAEHELFHPETTSSVEAETNIQSQQANEQHQLDDTMIIPQIDTPDKVVVEEKIDEQIEEKPKETDQYADEDPEEEWAEEETYEEEISDADDGSEKKTKRAATIDALIAKIKKNRDFPTMSHNISELNTKASLDRTSARQLANVILKDYGLTNKLLRLANSPFYGQCRGRVMTVSRAVVIMGFEQVRQMALGVMLFEGLQTKNRHQAKALMDSTYSSLMSGLVAKGMAKRIGRVNEEEAFVCAMYRKLGEYLCIYYLPKEYREIKRFIKKHGKTMEDATVKVLGISLTELGQAMAEKWEFPEQIRKSMKQLPKGQVPKPRDYSEELRNLSGLADELTQIAAEASPENRKKALKDLAHRFKDSHPISDDQLATCVNEATREIRDYSKLLDLNINDSPFIRRVLHMPDKTDKSETISDLPDFDSSEPPQDIVDESQVNRQKELKQILVKGIEEITLAMTGIYDLSSILMMVLETMYRGLDLSRVVFCMHEAKQGALVARSGFGDGVDEMIKHFRFQPRRGQDLFNRSVSRGSDIIVNDTKDARYIGKLPVWYRRIANPLPPMLLIYPVMVRNYPTGLFYGDQLEPKQTISRELLVEMDKLRNLATRSIREKGPSG